MSDAHLTTRAKPVLSENPTNEEMNEALRWGIDTLKEHRQTHVEWRDWFRLHPNDSRIQSLGDADFHNETIQHYNVILSVLNYLLEVDAVDAKPGPPQPPHNPIPRQA